MQIILTIENLDMPDNAMLRKLEKALADIGIECTIELPSTMGSLDDSAGIQTAIPVDITQYLPEDESLHTPHLLARAHLKTGDYEKAIALWNEHVDEAPEAMLNIGLALYWSGKYVEALTIFDRGIRASSKDANILARTSLARAMCLQEMGRVIEARGDVDRALAIAESTNDDALRARAYRAMNLLYVWTGPARTAREYGDKAIKAAKKAGEPALEWSAHWAMALLAGMTGDAKGVGKHLEGCKELAESLGSPVLPLWAAEIEIEYATGLGAWDTALEKGEAAIAAARALNQNALLPRLLVWTGIAYLNVGNEDTAKLYFDEAWKMTGKGTPLGAHATILAHTGKAAYHLHRKEYKQAIDIATRGVALADKMGYVVWAVHRLLPILGEAHLYLGDTDHTNFGIAQSLSDRMRRDAQVLDHKLGMAWADACDGLLIMLRDKDPAHSISLLRKSALALENIPFVEYATKIRTQLDLAMARANLGVGNFTNRERDIARLVGQGMSNKEIAREMDISERTVTTHMSNIFAKAGVRSRGELTVVMGAGPAL